MGPKFVHHRGLITTAITALLLAFAFADGAFAAEKSRQKVIDFEDEVVEGVNKRPLDSASMISERDKKRRKPHLYRKRASFRAEIAETLRELRYVP